VVDVDAGELAAEVDLHAAGKLQGHLKDSASGHVHTASAEALAPNCPAIAPWAPWQV
jgi:hypothetical protein